MKLLGPMAICIALIVCPGREGRAAEIEGVRFVDRLSLGDDELRLRGMGLLRHRLFFEGSTWIFPRSDTLIRLFPNRFWIDIGATLVGLLVIDALAVGVAGWIWRRRRARRGSCDHVDLPIP